MPGIVDALAALPPWEAAPYFQPPLMLEVTLSGAATVAVLGDPQTVALVFSLATGSQAWLGLTAAIAQQRGITLVTTNPTWSITYQDYGPLVQQTWYVNGALGAVVTVAVVKLARWPDLSPQSKRRSVRNVTTQSSEPPRNDGR